MKFYSIYVPVTSRTESTPDEGSLIFSTLDDALKCLKKHKDHKDARLKDFDNHEDAFKYSQTGYENTDIKFSELKSPSSASEKITYRTPTKPELTQFRKKIEEDKYAEVLNMIMFNPRYLINSGDTPTNLKEGFRYNALHICAISKRAKIAELILQTISSTEFITLLHGRQNDKICHEVSEILLNYYLNMPEKGRCETPLHLAAKYGSVEVIEVLTLYPQCKMIPNQENLLPKDIICARVTNPSSDLIEKIEMLLQERFYVPVIRSIDSSVAAVIGEPYSQSDPPDLKTNLLSPKLQVQAYAGPMTKDQAQEFRRRWKTPPRTNISPTTNLKLSPYISPIKFDTSTPNISNNNNIKSNKKLVFDNLNESNSGSPIENEDNTNGNTDLNTELNDRKPNMFGAGDCQNNNDPVIHKSVEMKFPKIHLTLTPRPIDSKRDSFYIRHQHISPKVLKGDHSLNASGFFDDIQITPKKLFVADICKDNGTFLTPHIAVTRSDLFSKYREPMISTPIQFDSNDTFNNSYSMRGSNEIPSPAQKERHVKLSDPEKGLEQIGRALANEKNYGWREYWEFLGCFTNIASPEGLDKFETLLNKRTSEANLKKNIENHCVYERSKEDSLINNLCAAFQHVNVGHESFSLLPSNNELTVNILNDYQKLNGTTSSPSSCGIGGKAKTLSPVTAPYLCVEKSLQVFAKRCTKMILHNIDSVTSINDTFLSELKRLKSLICSFKDDNRFMNIEYTMVHSRFANLIAIYIKNSENMNKDILSKIRQCFNQIIECRIKVMDKSLLYSPSSTGFDKKEQLQCVSEMILQFLSDQGITIQPENLKTELICSETWMKELKCECLWNNTLSRQTSRKKRLEMNIEPRQLFGIPSGQYENHNNIVEKPISLDAWRSSNDSNDSEIDDSIINTDDDEFWSVYGSEGEENDDRYYTPPTSPKPWNDLDHDESDDYNIYVWGDTPTKTDLDVINALFHVCIKKEEYPHIHRWQTAVLNHSVEERDNFLSVFEFLKRKQTNDDDSSVHKNSQCSMPSFRSPIIKFTDGNLADNSSGNKALNLSYMNVSDSL